MHVRVVRFTGVTADKAQEVESRIEESGGPPEGVPSSGIQLLFDESQGTAVVLQFYDTPEDLKTGEQVLDAMDASETPGTRVSVDRCELRVDRKA
jgi:hypothetical protein